MSGKHVIVLNHNGAWTGIELKRLRMKVEQRFAWMNKTLQDILEENGLPQTVKQAVDFLLEHMLEEDRVWLSTLPKKDMIKFHFGAGMWVRNNFGLWKENKALLKDTGKEHPDDASGVILDAVWERVNGNY